MNWVFATNLKLIIPKVLMQGKLFQRCVHFFVLQCTVFGRKSKHKTDVTAWHGINCHKNNLWNILVLEAIMWIIKIIKIKCFYPPRILDEHISIFFCLQIPPRENWFQHVRRVYATAINFPCIITLISIKDLNPGIYVK